MIKGRVIVILISVFAISSVFAQSNRFGTITASAGYKFGLSVPTVDLNFEKGYSGEVPIGALSFNSIYPLELNVGLARPLSVGVQFSKAKFVIVSEFFYAPINARTVAFNVNLHLINRKYFNMALSLSPGRMSFNDVQLNFMDEELLFGFEGKSFSSRLKFNFFFNRHIGVYTNIGYDIQRINVKDFQLSIIDQEKEAEIRETLKDGIGLNMRGLNVGVGLVVKI